MTSRRPTRRWRAGSAAFLVLLLAGTATAACGQNSGNPPVKLDGTLKAAEVLPSFVAGLVPTASEFVRISTPRFDSKRLAGDGYKDFYSPTWRSSKISTVVDSTIPDGPAPALRYVWDRGDGQSPGRAAIKWPGARKVFATVWVRHSANWEFNSSSTNKILYFANTDNPDYDGEMFLNYRNDRKIWFCLQAAQGYRAAYNPTADRHRYLPPNVRATIVKPGLWHRIDLLLERSTGGKGNGRVRWWVDGLLNGDHSDVRFQSVGDVLFDGVVIDPIWGGGGVKAHGDTLWFARLSVATQP